MFYGKSFGELWVILSNFLNCALNVTALFTFFSLTVHIEKFPKFNTLFIKIHDVLMKFPQEFMRIHTNLQFTKRSFFVLMRIHKNSLENCWSESNRNSEKFSWISVKFLRISCELLWNSQENLWIREKFIGILVKFMCTKYERDVKFP